MLDLAAVDLGEVDLVLLAVEQVMVIGVVADVTPKGQMQASLTAEVVPLHPFHEFAKQRLLRCRVTAGSRRPFGQEAIKSDLLHFGCLRQRRHVVPLEPILRGLEALPAGN